MVHLPAVSQRICQRSYWDLLGRTENTGTTKISEGEDTKTSEDSEDKRRQAKTVKTNEDKRRQVKTNEDTKTRGHEDTKKENTR
jgi:hypothetical protein